ncbi:MAG: hypothetical protein KAH22_06215 [Thiotrichaceae bacterium]|nr:hypothetical protein [Thiotrichaceae bacterium]
MNNNKRHWSAVLSGLVLLLVVSVANATSPRHQQHWVDQNPVTIDIINDHGRGYNKHKHTTRGRKHRAYLEAKKNERYSIRIRNRSNRRVGVVLTVDGRNVVSGKKSHLRSSERMYILGPHETATYKGWRRSKNKINRFFFTNAGNSYAGAWGDYSAVGVVAAAVYYEKPQPVHHHKQVTPQVNSAPNFMHRGAPAPAPSRRAAQADSIGTGYGRSEHSASTQTTFRAKTNAQAKYFYKYEWRNTLCQHNIIHCYTRPVPKPVNRFWPNDNSGFAAPPPPRHGHHHNGH